MRQFIQKLFNVIIITLFIIPISLSLLIVPSAGVVPSYLYVIVFSEGNIHGSFTKGDRSLYFETVRGQLNPHMGPEAPPYELSIRVMDSNFIPFLNQIAGHEPARLGWKEDQEEIIELPIDYNDRLSDFIMIPDMIKELIKYNKKHKDTKVVISALISLLESFKETELCIKDIRILTPAPPAPPAPKKYKFKTKIRKKPVLKPFPYEHSALLVDVYDKNGKFIYRLETCNHGTCASNKQMSTKCSKTFERDDIKAHAWDLMCDSFGYKFNLIKGPHVCNNDTLQEYSSVKYGKEKNWGVCNTPIYFAPDCN